MAIKFNIDEVLKMAVRIEQGGAAFYTRAAGLKKDAASADFLKKLAAVEKQHQAAFEAMRAELTDDEKEATAYDPWGEAELYLEAMADTHGGEGDPKAAAKLTGRESLADILTTAIGMEKDSILFYVGIKELVPAHLGGKKIDKVIKEEWGHVAILQRHLKELA